MVSAAITGNINVSGSTFSASLQKNETAAGFGNIMAKSLQNNAKTDYKKTDSKAEIKTASDKDVKSKNAADATETKKADAEETKESDNTSHVNKDTATEKNTFISDSEAADEENLSKVVSALEKIADKIKKTLGISDEELENILAGLGITLNDLVNTQAITQVVIAATGSEDAFALITDSELSTNLKDILEFANIQFEQLAQDIDIPVEDMAEYIGKAEFSEVKEAAVESAEVVEQPDVKEPITAENAKTEEQGDNLESVIGSKLTVETDETAKNSDSAKDFFDKSDNSDKMQNNQSVITDNGLGQIAESFENAFEQIEGVDAADVVRQVVDQIKFINTRTVQTLEVVLNPENLGKVNISVSLKEGLVTAQITAENEQVKKALESQIITLKDNFENQGIKVEAVEVTVSSNAFESNQNFSEGEKQQQSSKARRKLNLDDFSFEDEQLQEDQEIPVNENSSVEYMA